MTLRAVIAGATGLIGSNLADHLVSKGWEVYGIVRKPQGSVPGVRPIAADLLEKLRKIEGGPVHKPLSDKQLEILDRIVQKAGDGHPKTLGLRLVLAASEDELAAAWPIGLLSKALHASGRRTEGNAVQKVAHGCRVSRFRDMAAVAFSLLNQKIEAAKVAEK